MPKYFAAIINSKKHRETVQKHSSNILSLTNSAPEKRTEDKAVLFSKMFPFLDGTNSRKKPAFVNLFFNDFKGKPLEHAISSK